MKKIALSLVALGFLECGSLLVLLNAWATELYVPSPYATIQVAINAAVNGDTVWVNDGTYIENINVKSEGKVI